MFKIILFEPEIPPNTGNIIRLCANTGCSLHLIKPLGFTLDNKQLRRAGLDYDEFAELQVYDNLEELYERLGSLRVFACSTRANTHYTEPAYQEGDALLFGPETRGLPVDILDCMPAERKIRIPMRAQSRSLNLSNAVSIITYEAWRQHDFR